MEFTAIASSTKGASNGDYSSIVGTGVFEQIELHYIFVKFTLRSEASMRRDNLFHMLVIALVGILPSTAHAQRHKLRVISTDSQPVIYAYVTTDGGTGQITDEKGEISLGSGKAKTLTVNVRRIGYQQWFGKLELPDTALVMTVMLPRATQSLATVTVTGNGRGGISVPLQGFYDRWMMRQKGSLSAVFIGPEELEFRNPNRITAMLQGLNGVSLQRFKGQQVVMGYAGRCQMAIMLDGVRLCPAMGCKCDDCGSNGPSLSRPSSARQIMDSSSLFVQLDQIVNPGDVSAIEVYPRGGNMPVSLQVSDAACGVVAIWTGSRKP